MCVTAAGLLDFAKSFAGPLAVIAASGSATWITWRIGKRQVEIADAQQA